MTLNEYIDNLDAAINELESGQAANEQKIARDALALTKRRVIQTGVSQDGSKFSDYSPGYARYRSDLGRPTNYKNFSLTNQMWNSLDAVVIEQKPGINVIAYINEGEFNNNKRIWNSNREQKPIAALNEKEIQLLTKFNLARIEGVLKKYKLI